MCVLRSVCEPRILFTSAARGGILYHDTPDCTVTGSGSVPVTEYSWRMCLPGDQCGTSGTGITWEEEFFHIR
jgi:hypothetical protein